MHDNFVNTPQAAKLVHRTADALRMWRFKGYGPPFFKIGALVLYDRVELMKWFDAQRREPTHPKPIKIRAPRRTKPAPAANRKVARNRKTDTHAPT